MALERKTFTLVASTREDARRQIVSCFLHEKSGKGMGDLCSKYEYEVEEYCGYKIVLKRPTWLNKGFDFTVNVEGFSFKRKNKIYENPRHADVIDVLQQMKMTLHSDEFKTIKEIIRKIFLLENVDLNKLKDITFKDYSGKDRPIAVILLAIRWLFLEQDITYWNYSGRGKLMEAFCNEGLADMIC